MNVDKDLAHKQILDMYRQGMTYRQICVVLGIHWTRMEQFVKEGGNKTL
jgi:transposase-like protein